MRRLDTNSVLQRRSTQTSKLVHVHTINRSDQYRELKYFKPCLIFMLVCGKSFECPDAFFFLNYSLCAGFSCRLKLLCRVITEMDYGDQGIHNHEILER
jgi:hypothetical protein